MARVPLSYTVSQIALQAMHRSRGRTFHQVVSRTNTSIISIISMPSHDIIYEGLEEDLLDWETHTLDLLVMYSLVGRLSLRDCLAMIYQVYLSS